MAEETRLLGKRAECQLEKKKEGVKKEKGVKRKIQGEK